MSLRLTLAHVNHGVRDSAWQDEAVALSVSAALRIPAVIRALHPVRGEAAMRDARYAALEMVAREREAAVVATAHTASDQTETVLLSLFRGAGADGLCGMPARRALSESVALARPLLRLDREDLLAYVRAANLPYAIDPSNADIAFRRNAVRQALQTLRPLFPGLDEAVARAAHLLASEQERTTAAGLRRRVRAALGEHEALRGVDFKHVEAAVRALEQGTDGRFWMAPGIELAVRDRSLHVRRGA